MLATLRNRLTFANTMSVLAVFIALGGSAYAAAKITGKQIKDGSLTTKDIKNRSLLKVDFKRGQLPAAATVTVRAHTENVQTSCSSLGGSFFCSGQGTVTSQCAAGERATGGGYRTGNSSSSASDSRPNAESGTPTGWTVQATAGTTGTGSPPSPAPAVPFTTYAVCATP